MVIASDEPFAAGQWLLGLGLTLVGYTMLGAVLLPALIRWQLPSRLAAITQRAVTIQQVRLNPFSLTLTVRGVTLTETNGDVCAAVRELSAQLRFASFFQRGWVFKEIRLEQPTGSVVLEADGTCRFANLWPGRSAPALRAPRLRIERLRVEDGTLVTHDRDHPSPLRLSQIALLLEGLTTQTNSPVAAVLSLRCNETGTVTVRGMIHPETRTADVQVQATNLDLRALQPYIAEIWRLEITGGTLSATGRVQYAATGMTVPQVQFTGELSVAQFASVDKAAHEEFLQLDRLTLTGLELRYQPQGLAVAAVDVVGLRGHVFIHPDKTTNWRGLLQNAEKLHALLVRLQLDRGFPFQIGRVTVAQGALGFADRSIDPPVVAAIENVAGCITGLSSTDNATVHVELQGKLGAGSTVTVTGTIQPLADDLQLDLALALQNNELPPGSPYAAKYAGYPVQRGQLSLTAHYTVKDHVLRADNKFRVQQLRLGPRSDSPDATQLRVKLAVALLQDRDGVLTFELPVTGRLDDPQFKLGPVLAQLVTSIITKAVSNPFGLLGALVGGVGQLSFVSFEPGRADFVAGESRKLDTLAKALAARPALELEITGAVDPASDRHALAAGKLEQQLLARQIAERAAAGAPGVGADPSIIAPQDYAPLLQRVYIAVVGTNPVVVVAPQPLLGPTQNFGSRRLSGGAANLLVWQPLPGLTDFAELTLADKAAGLLAAIEVTAEDFRALMQARAAKVQQYLVALGPLTADRLSIATPKVVDASYRGQSRVELALE